MNSVSDPADFTTYHRSLKVYLGLAPDHLTPATSLRVAKARQKLGKLTEIQFYDLSTDVYDELQRRVNENSEQPKHLPAQPVYHPKRNQARQKLSVLPSQRFKDLVNDVLFEIERRDLIQPQYEQQNQTAYESKPSQYEQKPIQYEQQQRQYQAQPKQYQAQSQQQQQQQQQYQAQPQESQADQYGNQYQAQQYEDQTTTRQPQNQHEDAQQQYEPAQAKQIGQIPESDRYADMTLGEPAPREIKAAKVVPQRAELTWSSDEEDEGTAQAREAVRGGDLTKKHGSSDLRKEAQIKSLGRELTDLQDQVTSLQKKNRDLEQRATASSEYNDKYEEANASLQRQIEKNHQLSESLSEVQQEKSQLVQLTQQQRRQFSELQRELSAQTKDREMAPSQDDVDDLNAQIIQLKRENAQLVEEHANLQKDNDNIQRDLSSLQKDHRALKEDHSALKQDHSALKEEHSALQDSHMALQDEHSSLQKDNRGLLQQTHELKKSASATPTREVKAPTRQVSLNESLDTASDITELQSYCSTTGLIPVDAVSELYLSTESLLNYVSGKKLSTNGLFSGVSSLTSAAEQILKSAQRKNQFDKQAATLRSSIATLLTVTRYYSLYKDVCPAQLMHSAIDDLYFAVCDLLSVAKVRATSDKLASTVASKKVNASPAKPSSKGLELDTPHTPIYDDSPSVRPLRMAEKLNSQETSKEKSYATPPSALKHGLGSKMSPINPIQVNSGYQKRDAETPTKSKYAAKDASFYKSADVSVSSLASKFSHESNDKSPSSQRSSPYKDNDSVSRLKQKFESPEYSQSQSQSQPSPPIKVGKGTAESFDKFGAKRRSTDSETSLDRPVPERSSPDRSISNPLLHSVGPSEPSSKESQSTIKPQTIGTTGGLMSPIQTPTEPTSGQQEEDFDIEKFNTLDPDNTLKELLLYLEHQTVEVIAAIQRLLSSIRDPKATRGLLGDAADQIVDVVKRMCEGTRTLMNQSRYADTMSHTKYVVDVLDDCVDRMAKLYGPPATRRNSDYADKSFKQRSAGIAFDIARSTKELVKTVEEASLRDEIAVIDSRLNNQ